MHDIDRIRLETQQPETGMFEAGPFEAEQFEFAQTGTPSGETGEVFSETEQMELASELLEITSEAELDRFLGDLIGRAGNAMESARQITRRKGDRWHPERRCEAGPARNRFSGRRLLWRRSGSKTRR